MSRPLSSLWPLALAALGCGGDPDTRALQQALTDFEQHAQQTGDSLASLYVDTVALDAALQASDKAKTDALLDRIPGTLSGFETAVVALQEDEEAIQAALAGGAGGGSGSALTQRLEVEKKGFFASLRKLFDFGARYRALSDSMSQARKDRDSAAEDLMNDVDGAQDRLAAAQNKMASDGKGALQELGTSVTVELVTAPIKPVTMAGTIFKTATKGVFKKGLTALTSTKACETDVTSASCTVGVAKTDEKGQVRAPVGTSSVVVSGGGNARVRVDTLDVKESPRMEVTREQVPIAEATPANVTRGDETGGVEEEEFDERKVRPLWMLCTTLDYSTMTSTAACFLFDGDTFDWQAACPDRAAQNGWCESHGHETWYTDYWTEAGCREACALGWSGCQTP